jgi:hypothetical protein
VDIDMDTELDTDTEIDIDICLNCDDAIEHVAWMGKWMSMTAMDDCDVCAVTGGAHVRSYSV